MSIKTTLGHLTSLYHLPHSYFLKNPTYKGIALIGEKIHGILGFESHRLHPEKSLKDRVPTQEGRPRKYIDLSKKGLEQVPSYVRGPKVEFLDLSQNLFKGELSLSDLPNLKYLSLRRSIQPGTRLGPLILPNLQTLSLADNELTNRQLTHWLQQSFLPNLIEISLRDNRLLTFPNLGRIIPYDRIEELELAGNAIESIPITDLDAMPSLDFLTVSKNKLTSFPPIDKHPKLRTVLAYENPFGFTPAQRPDQSFEK